MRDAALLLFFLYVFLPALAWVDEHHKHRTTDYREQESDR